MKVVLTGSSGRIGRAIFGSLISEHEVVGIDRTPFATTHLVADFAASGVLDRALEGADVVIHTAAYHAPQVGLVDDQEFERVNVAGTASLVQAARASGVRRIVFTSTTALYGNAVEPGRCVWIDEDVRPQPKTIYHRTKLAAEQLLEEAASSALQVRVVRMSRCFPEPADIMATYRLHRGIDARDVGDAHRACLVGSGAAFQRFVVSGHTPFERQDCEALAKDAAAVIEARAPELAAEFQARGWQLPKTIDRIYVSNLAEERLNWRARLGPDEVFAQLDRRDLEVLPERAKIAKRAQ